MRRTVWAMATLLMLGACGGGGPDAVGENSAGSIKTTAMGEVVANVAAPTPTPETSDVATNSTDVATDAADDVADNSTAH